MRVKLYVLLASILLLSGFAVAQDPEKLRLAKEWKENRQREKHSIDQAVNSSPAAVALHQKLTLIRNVNEQEEIFLALGKEGDKSIVPYLKALESAGNCCRRYITVALVRLGEQEYFDKTLEEIASEDISVQDRAIWKLSLFKTRESYRKLYELLDDLKERDKTPFDDDMRLPNAYTVIARLAETVENPPTGTALFEIAAWKAWFAKNKHLIE